MPLKQTQVETLLTSAQIPVASPGGTFILPKGIALVNLTTGALSILSAITPGFRFKVVSVNFSVGTPGTGSGATQAISTQISGVAVTGGVVTPTLANTATFGATIAGTAVTGTNEGSATDTLSIVSAAGGVVFTAGAGDILVTLQNLDG